MVVRIIAAAMFVGKGGDAVGEMRWCGYDDKNKDKENTLDPRLKMSRMTEGGVEDDGRGREWLYLIRYSILFNFPVTNLWRVLEMRVW